MTTTRLLAFIAGAAALLAAFAGAPDASSLTRADARAHVKAIDAAHWIREQRRVHVLDLRDQSAYQELAVPTATHATLAELATLAVPRADTIVVYAADGSIGAHAQGILHSGGWQHVYVLSGGIYGWVTDVLNPTLPEQATAEQEAAFARVSELSRYFGGVPRRGDPVAAAAADSTAQQTRDADAVRRIQRRGC
jgi:rhodanese-related sulfurtransferase